MPTVVFRLWLCSGGGLELKYDTHRVIMVSKPAKWHFHRCWRTFSHSDTVSTVEVMSSECSRWQGKSECFGSLKILRSFARSFCVCQAFCIVGCTNTYSPHPPLSQRRPKQWQCGNSDIRLQFDSKFFRNKNTRNTHNSTLSTRVGAMTQICVNKQIHPLLLLSI